MSVIARERIVRAARVMNGAPSLGHPDSLWAATAVADFPWTSLTGTANTTVAVVGGGFAGRNGGQVIPGLKYDPDEGGAQFGPELDPRMVRAANEGFGLITRHGIECGALRTRSRKPWRAITACAII